MRRALPTALAGVVAGLALAAPAPAAVSAPASAPLTLREFRVAPAALEAIRKRQAERVLRAHAPGTWAPLPTRLTDADLRAMGLPPKRHLLGKRFPVPTAVYPDGRTVRLTARRGKGGRKPSGSSQDQAVVAYAGAGFAGIRPGALLLTVTDRSIGWCSMAHVFGSPGGYSISTAGHCGKTGDIGTVIGVVGNRPGVPVLLDFGKYSRSTGDGGIGRDWALISVFSQFQDLVTPTMAGWGGPFGVYTRTGDVVSANLFARKGPQVAVNPDPLLAQQVVHYGHGTGVGFPVGTPRSGTAITWRPDYFTFFGAITPGDSGSGTNTLTGDTVGAQREAAGINTHIYVDPSLRTGVGLMAGTRTTKIGAPANGQLIPYPAPTPVPLP